MSEFELLDRKEGALRAAADVLDKEAAEIRQRREAITETLQRITEARATLQELLLDESGAGEGPEEHRVEPGDDEKPGSDEPSSEEEHGADPGNDPASSARSPIGMKEARHRAVALLATSGLGVSLARVRLQRSPGGGSWWGDTSS
ncbi:hypothetical protein [Streptomyces sp. NBC_01518]|uniref:hypothetical protein n=1 Tax=Streptomyces sp. NBC_01518 TaxID=2903891 RepID=UPI00386957EB